MHNLNQGEDNGYINLCNIFYLYDIKYLYIRHSHTDLNLNPVPE